MIVFTVFGILAWLCDTSVQTHIYIYFQTLKKFVLNSEVVMAHIY
jgi:anaerobic C4-dicarboxylate transporter